MERDPNIPTRAKPSRVEIIDMLRGWAVIVMIETHVFNATLSGEATSSTLFYYLKFFNGLVAPSFLFASGLAYAVTTRRKMKQYLQFGRPLFKQLSRILLILAIGYILHVPFFSLQRLRAGITTEQYQGFFQVDILQCIAVTLLILQCTLFLFRVERIIYWVTGALGVGFVFLAPIVWGIDFWTILPWPIAAYLNGLRYSLFPLFPWAGFLLAGTLAGFVYVTAHERNMPHGAGPGEISMMRSLLWIGGSAILLSVAIEPLAGYLYPGHDYWRASPGFFFLRLGLVAVLCSFLHMYQQWRGISPHSIITLFGRESLLIYVLHLLMIYGTFGEFKFAAEAGQSFGYDGAGITTILLLLLMYVSARFWSHVKKESPRLKVIFNVCTVTFAIGLFIFGSGE